MSAYREFTGKTVEEALRNAREAFDAGLDDLDFEILTPGSRGVLGMGAEPARIVAAPRAALGGAAPKREAAASQPLPPPPAREPRESRGYGDRDRGPRRDERGGRGPRRDERSGAPRADRPPLPDEDVRPAPVDAVEGAPVEGAPATAPQRAPRREDRGRDRGPRRDDRGRRAPQAPLSATESAELTAGRGSVAAERAELAAAEASPEALEAGRKILEELMGHLGFDVRIDVETGETSRLNVVGEGDEKDALGALIGRKGERLSALQHLVNLMLSRQMNEWTRVLVDVEDYRGRRERQLRDLATRAAARVAETGKMLQLEPMPALERRWVHIALRDNPDVVTQSVGEEPNRRVVVLPRGG
jgi:spoIIIJ-associated protein